MVNTEKEREREREKERISFVIWILFCVMTSFEAVKHTDTVINLQLDRPNQRWDCVVGRPLGISGTRINLTLGPEPFTIWTFSCTASYLIFSLRGSLNKTLTSNSNLISKSQKVENNSSLLIIFYPWQYENEKPEIEKKNLKLKKIYRSLTIFTRFSSCQRPLI